MLSPYRLQFLLAAGNAALWLSTLYVLWYRQAWIDEIARMMEQGR